ncbi:hypothetical protein [Mycetohabitans rhizoxinica]|uniref:Hemolysin n=1 Tax=Mycetohabitans rhizoxinica TaxID=412963 RepID=A0ABZ2PYZ1_9BURK
MGLNKPTSEAINASVNHDAASREVIAKQTLGAAAGAAAIAVGGPVAALPGAPIFSSKGALGSGMWASPVGTGIISGGINAGSQYLQNGDINPVDVAAATMAGPVGVYGGLGWNVGVNAVGGAASTVINNWLYGKNDSVMFSGIAAGVASSFGYGVGKSMEKAIESASRPTINSVDWDSVGKWVGSSGWNLFRPNNVPAIGSSVGGGFGSEFGSSVLNNIRDRNK